jgi:hypothetical protein
MCISSKSLVIGAIQTGQVHYSTVKSQSDLQMALACVRLSVHICSHFVHVEIYVKHAKEDHLVPRPRPAGFFPSR